METEAHIDSSDDLVRHWVPSIAVLWGIVVGIAVMGAALVALESGLEDESLPDFIWAEEGETTDDEIEYANKVGIDPAAVALDLDAVEELDRRDIEVCPAVDAPAVPADLAARAPVSCPAFDGHGGVGYPLVATAVAALGAGLYTWKRNRIGLYLTAVVLFDMVGAVAGAYAFRSLVFRPGSLIGGHVAAYIASLSWIPLLIVAVPVLILMLPTGRLVSPRWRIVVHALVAVAVVLALIQLVHPFLLGPILNPVDFGLAISTANSAFDLANTAWLLLTLVALASLPWRLALLIQGRLTGRSE